MLIEDVCNHQGDHHEVETEMLELPASVPRRLQLVVEPVGLGASQ